MSPKSRFALAALGVAWAGDLLFWKAAPGLNFSLWVGLALLVGFTLARMEKVQPARLTWLLAALALGFASITFLRSESFTIFISLLLSLACLTLLAGTFRHANWPFYRLVDYAKSILLLMLAAIIRPLEGSSKSKIDPNGEAPRKPPSSWRIILPVLRGILLAFPVLLIFTTLLSSADPIFGDQVKQWLAWFNLDHLGEFLFRLIYILILAYVLTGIYLHGIHPSKSEARPTPEKDWVSRLLGWTETLVILVLVNALFMVFVGIQFWYLFGGQTNISTTQYTYAEYARRGFNELVIVAVLSLGMYLFLATITRLAERAQKRWFSSLNTLLFVQVLVILTSAFQRLMLYEAAYGWTQLRTYTHFFIIWLALLLVATIVLELLRRRHTFALAGLVFALGFGLTIGLLNVDGFIAQRNVERARLGFELDARYLSNLSSDAVPTLLNEYLRSENPATVKDALGAELACRTAALQDQRTRDWRGTNVSEASAQTLLSANQSNWIQYPVTRSGRSLIVKVNGKEKTCTPPSRMLD